MRIRKAKLRDCKSMWLIRNHPKVRKNSLNRKTISYREHQRWFEDYLKNKSNVCYVLERNKEVLGYCRFDAKGNERVVSIAISPKSHGKGLGSYLLQNSIRRLKNKKNITATISLDNEISLALFQKNGFKIIKKDKNNYYLTYRGA
jgi:ribosomal protein S18 acetylase RimI-like enzyme